MYERSRSVSNVDFIHLLANRLYFSHIYSVLYVVMIVLNTVIIIWMLKMPGGYDGSLTFLMLQVTVNIVLVVEVMIRLVSQKEKFCTHCSNIFDVFVMTIAIVSQMLYIHPPDVAAAAITTEEWEDLGATIFRIIRDGVLFARLYIFWKNRHKNQISDSTTIDFEAVSDEYPLLFDEKRLRVPL